jgi:PII-like signaling protein
VLVGKSSVVDCDVEVLSVRIPTVVEIISSSMDANLSQSVIKSEIISSSSTIIAVPINSSES